MFFHLVAALRSGGRTVTAALSLLAFLVLAHAAPGVTPSEIVLGQSIYLTGALAELGQDFTAGANAYFSRINASGGIHSRKIRVVTLDDAYDPKRTVANIHELNGQGVFALWQIAGTGPVEKAALMADQLGIPLVAAIATGPQLRSQTWGNTIFVRPGNTEELQSIIDQLMISDVQQVAVVYVEAPYGHQGLQAVEAMLRAHGRALVAKVSMQVNGQGADKAVAALAAIQPQATILVTVPDATKAVILEARKAQLNSQLYALNAALPIGLVHQLGEAAHGVIVCQIMPNVNDTSIPVVQEAKQAMQGGRLTSAVLEGFINAKIMVEALRRTGNDPTRSGLIQAIESMSTYDAGGFVVHFSHAVHAGSKTVELSIISGNGVKFIY